MTQGHHALTEKEKQALRLLTSGHDAKTMALHLGLSVHTVNERLRDARRKMGTSSSREAARLLRDIEGPGPQNLVHEDFGDAVTAERAPHPLDQPRGDMPSSRTRWITGGIVMTFALAVLALAIVSGPEAPPQTPATAAVAAETATVAAARQWLALLDASDWDASWDATGKSFKSVNTSARWAEVSRQVRLPLGAIKSRELASVNYAPAPPQGYWVVTFRASYANKANVTETVSLAREDGSWRVVGVMVE